MRSLALAFAFSLALPGCALAPALIAAAPGLIASVAQLAAERSQPVAQLVNDGLLFCQGGGLAAAMAVANAAGIPVFVVEHSADDVARICPLGSAPVPPPPDVAAAPVVTAASAHPV